MYMSQQGDLYFANVEERDSRNDYCCFAAFPRLRTIVQKMPMKLTVNSCESKSLLSRGGCRIQCVCDFTLAHARESGGGIFHRRFSSAPDGTQARGSVPAALRALSLATRKPRSSQISIFRLPSTGLVISSGRNTMTFQAFPGTSQALTHRINQLKDRRKETVTSKEDEYCHFPHLAFLSVPNGQSHLNCSFSLLESGCPTGPGPWGEGTGDAQGRSLAPPESEWAWLSVV